jgi:Mrp family chromosome partitioning ATPase/predicted Fe-Mo cluster-binding NifX family protein
MSENCKESCSSCGDDCDERKEERTDFKENIHELSEIKKVIAVVSGKGGVGKSLVTSLLAVAMNRRGYKTAILDADITGPSIPKSFGITEKVQTSEFGLYPLTSKTGIEIMSINLLLENETDPVIWRGPIIGNMVKQFWTDVIWHDIDFMFIDMPPGTGDVPLTVFQSLKVDGIIIVTSPQELVSMIVTKAVKMANMMNIPIIGIVENMAYFKCPDCNKEYKIFGDSNIQKISQKHTIPILAKMPIDPSAAVACDKGLIEYYVGEWLEKAADILEVKLKANTKGESKMKIAVASENEMVTEHFGHCINFNIFESENGQILKSESIPNPGHKPGFLPNYLNDLGVNVIISGGMGGGAIEIFNEKNLEVIVGASGYAKSAAEAYLAGALKSTGSVCHEHQHQDSCGGH